MGIILGYSGLICFCLLALKAVTAKLHLKKPDRALMLIHKFVSAFLVIICFLHILFVVPVVKNRNVLVTVSGIIIVMLMFLLIYLCHVIEDQKKKIWWHRVMTIFMVIGIIGHFAIYILDFNTYKRNVAGINFDNIDFGDVKDGIYEGECDVGYIYARVEVEIKNGIIVSVKLLEHRNEQGECAESIIDDVLAEQKIDVDAVSGATNSSNVIKKAIENAVRN